MTLDLGLHDPGGDAGPAPPEGVGLPRRGLARVIDLVVSNLAVAAGGILALVVAAIFGDASTGAAIELLSNEEDLVGGRLGELTLGLLSLTLVHTLGEGLHGSTVGKRLCGITVVTEDGRRAGPRAAFKRSVGFLVDQLFFGLVGAHRILQSSRAQRVGDEWAGTMVVRLGAVEPASRRSAPKFLAATGAALAAAAALGTIVVGLQIVRSARLARQDRVEIVAVRPARDARLVGGQPARFSLTVSHTLRSRSDGRLLVYVVHGEEEPQLQGTFSIRGGSGRTDVAGTARLPESQPGYSDPALPYFVVELYPAKNEASASAIHVFGLERRPCPDAAVAHEICVG